MTIGDGIDLRHHGDTEVGPGLLDLAVNVRLPEPPAWLRARLADSLRSLAAYPDQTVARAAVAARHGRDPAEVLLTAGAAEAFVLIARATTARKIVCVHPSFTEPEAALRAAGHEVRRVVLEPPFVLDPALVPDDADLVVLGNPTNPTSRLHPAEVLASLARPGRMLVVDEAFSDAVPGEPQSLAGRTDIPGLVVVRSLTKTWGLAGLRIGYVLADAATIARLTELQPIWSVSTPALVAAAACSGPEALAWAAQQASETAETRSVLANALAFLPGVELVPEPRGPFVLIKVIDGLAVRERLRDNGIAVRRGDTFPGLGPDWLRLAVPAAPDVARVIDTLKACLEGSSVPVQAEPVIVVAGPSGGSVTLIGCGPGDADLLTVRAWRSLQEADVVVADRLVSREVLNDLHPGVEIIDVGKAPGHQALPQEGINALLVEKALAGHRVVRLKGGDPFVFGRGGEELLACAAAGIACTVIPGLSTAISVPTLAGIPVTHRGLSQSFTVISGHLAPGDPGSTVDWASHARSTETLVLLMSVGRLPAIVTALLDGGRASETPVAAVERGGTPDQRLVRAPLGRFLTAADDANLTNPAIVVIGAVAGDLVS